MKISPVVLIAIGITLAACGPQRSSPTPQPTATSIPTSTATPLPPTPIPTVALPTVTPSPPPNPASIFLDWMDANGYVFTVDVNDGSKRYTSTSEKNGTAIDIYPDSVVAWDIIIESDDAPVVLYETTNVIINAIASHGLDTVPVRSALASPYQLPLALQVPGYSFLLENSQYGFVTARVRFFEQP